MKAYTPTPMRPELVVCPKSDCGARDRIGMPALTRRTRTPSGAQERLEASLFWTGCVDHFCHVHATLTGTPAMAADLTDHGWSIEELFRYRCRRE